MNKQPEPFDLEAAKNGAEILCDGGPATFIAHLPDNVLAHRVVVSYNGRVYAFTEDGCCIENQKPRLTMAPRKVRTRGYRSYFCQFGQDIVRLNTLDIAGEIQLAESNLGFIRWVHDTWQYDEVEL